MEINEMFDAVGLVAKLLDEGYDEDAIEAYVERKAATMTDEHALTFCSGVMAILSAVIGKDAYEEYYTEIFKAGCEAL